MGVITKKVCSGAEAATATGGALDCSSSRQVASVQRSSVATSTRAGCKVQSQRSPPCGKPAFYLLAQLALVLSILLGSSVYEADAKMPDFLGKKYKLESSKNFDEFMKELGVGLITRTLGAAVYPTVEVTENNGEYTMKTTSTFKNQELKFRLGEEFDEETPDGRNVKSVITLDGNKMTHIQKGDKQTTIIREFGPEEMKAEMRVGNVVCTRVYKLQK